MKRLLILAQLGVLVCVLIVAAGPRKTFVVQIDAGHGGNDHGFITENGLTEKELVLQICELIEARLKDVEGVEVRLTRSDDSPIGLKERIELIGPDVNLLISMHADGSDDPSRRGMSLHTPTEGAYAGSSAKVADAFAESLRTLEIPIKNQTQEKFYILHHAPCPSVLISAGTLSNPDDARLLSGFEYQQDFAERVGDAIVRILP